MTQAKRFNFTKAALEALPLPVGDQRDTYHDTRQPALTVRVTETGKKTFRVRGRPRGQLKVETLTIGPFPFVTIEQARAAAADQLAKWSRTESIVAGRAEEQKQKRYSITFEDALREYVAVKRRGKDGLPLKARTRDDYLRMISPGQAGGDGKRELKPGELAGLASRPLNQITADELRATFAAVTEGHGQRRGTYAMAVARAVLNWHGTKVPENPFDRSTAGRDRIRLQQAPGRPNPIPVERLGAWWRAACRPPAGSVDPDVNSDYLRFLLLTGCRSIEAKGDKRGAVVYGEDYEYPMSTWSRSGCASRTRRTAATMSSYCRSRPSRSCSARSRVRRPRRRYLQPARSADVSRLSTRRLASMCHRTICARPSPRSPKNWCLSTRSSAC